MKLLLVRHAESEGNVAQVMQGQQEHPLSPSGHQQAQKLTSFLQDQLWSPTHIYSSPLERAMQTAQYCSGSLSIKPHNQLLEIHNGVFQGLTWEEAQREYPRLCQQMTQSLTWVAIPKAEAPHHVFARAREVIQWMLVNHHNDDRIWLFSHAGFIQHLVAQLMGCDRLWGLSIPPTGLFEFEINLDHWQTQSEDRFTGHLFRIVRFNQTPHG